MNLVLVIITKYLYIDYKQYKIKTFLYLFKCFSFYKYLLIFDDIFNVYFLFKTPVFFSIVL